MCGEVAEEVVEEELLYFVEGLLEEAVELGWCCEVEEVAGHAVYEVVAVVQALLVVFGGLRTLYYHEDG